MTVRSEEREQFRNRANGYVADVRQGWTYYNPERGEKPPTIFPVGQEGDHMSSTELPPSSLARCRMTGFTLAVMTLGVSWRVLIGIACIGILPVVAPVVLAWWLTAIPRHVGHSMQY